MATPCSSFWPLSLEVDRYGIAVLARYTAIRTFLLTTFLSEFLSLAGYLGDAWNSL